MTMRTDRPIDGSEGAFIRESVHAERDAHDAERYDPTNLFRLNHNVPPDIDSLDPQARRENPSPLQRRSFQRVPKDQISQTKRGGSLLWLGI